MKKVDFTQVKNIFGEEKYNGTRKIVVTDTEKYASIGKFKVQCVESIVAVYGDIAFGNNDMNTLKAQYPAPRYAVEECVIEGENIYVLVG